MNNIGIFYILYTYHTHTNEVNIVVWYCWCLSIEKFLASSARNIYICIRAIIIVHWMFIWIFFLLSTYNFRPLSLSFCLRLACSFVHSLSLSALSFPLLIQFVGFCRFFFSFNVPKQTSFWSNPRDKMYLILCK